MNSQAVPRLTGLSRRGFLRLTPAAVTLFLDGWRGRAWSRSDEPSPFERLHLPVLRLPVVTNNGAKVPVVVEMAHPMEPDHYITSVHVVNPRDPVPSKGAFYFTPANGQVYLAFQVRMDDGVSDVSVVAECNLHGRWSTTESVNIVEGAGGCAGTAAPPGRRAADEIRPPIIRIPAAVKGEPIRSDRIIDVQVKIKHPNRTGLISRNGKFFQESEPFYITDLSVFYGGERVSRYAPTSALSDDPFITFRLRARRGGPLRVALTNNRDQRFEAVSEIRVS